MSYIERLITPNEMTLSLRRMEFFIRLRLRCPEIQKLIWAQQILFWTR